MLFWNTFDAFLAFALALLCVRLVNQPPVYISCSVKKFKKYSESRQPVDKVKMEYVQAENGQS